MGAQGCCGIGKVKPLNKESIAVSYLGIDKLESLRLQKQDSHKTEEKKELTSMNGANLGLKSTNMEDKSGEKSQFAAKTNYQIAFSADSEGRKNEDYNRPQNVRSFRPAEEQEKKEKRFVVKSKEL